MHNLTILNKNGQFVTDSREVAEVTGKEHPHLLRDIRGYMVILGQSNFGYSDFFIEDVYLNSQNKEQPCYLLTKKGCDMVANKMTGAKGILFTAEYVTRFEEMKMQVQAPIQELSPQLQLLINMELEQKKLREQLNEVNHNALEAKAESAAVKQDLQGIRDVITLSPNSWRPDTSALINKMALGAGGYDHIRVIREESYKSLCERFGVDVKTRLTNKRRRMADEGICKSKRDKLTVLDVIAEDKKLIEGYVAIVKEMAIKYKTA
ncbi:MAG: Rha family transcriptional regulator [Clostridium sp.]|uniref:Rha family transcriptional regulator n=1 Tax=Clostridium sp. TaxID=1506 RepID=UPI003D6CE6A7